MGMHIRKGGKFMKLKKKSGLMGAVIALSAASLVSVGFASWVISQGDIETVDGQIIVDTVSNQSHDVSYTGTPSDIVFGHPSTMNASNEWLSNNDASKVESLVTTFNVKITNVSASQTVQASWFTLQAGTLSGETFTPETTVGATGYLKAASENLVAALPSPVFGSITYTAATGGDANLKDMEFSVTYTFGWGSAFGGENPQNPYDYYNAQSYTSVLGAEATTNLTNLYNYLNGVSYRVTIDVPANIA